MIVTGSGIALAAPEHPGSPVTVTPAEDVRLIGREREVSALDARLDAARDGGVVVLLRGDAGIGKSALLSRASDRAAHEDMRVLTVSGVRAEAHVPFAGLHQMVRPLLARAEGLAEPQRDALLATFGMTDASATNPLLVAVGVLELLANEARNWPLLVVVDDAHWLDRPSVDVFGFVARRLGSERVGLFIAVRDGYESALLDFGLPELRVEALDEESSRALLETRAPALGPGLRRRVLAAAAGNPLALVELAAAVSSRQPLRSGSGEMLPSTARLDQVLVERFHDLPPATRTLLTIASADVKSSPSEVLNAARASGEDPRPSLDDLDSAVVSGLVELDDRRIRFRHPLLPAAIYRAATPAQRHRTHAALAAGLIDEPERRAWHRAASTTSPDEKVAAELEQASLGAIARGTAGFTLALVERAAELTSDPSRRYGRLLRAAELAIELGQLDRATRLLGDVDPMKCDALGRARLGLLRDEIEPSLLGDPKAVDTLVDAALRMKSAGDINLALQLLHAATMRSWWADPGSEARRRVVATARHVPVPDSDPRVLSILGASDATSSSAMISEVASRIAPDTCDAKGALSVGTALHVTGAFALSSTFLAPAVAGLRDQSAVWLLAQALAQHAWNLIYAGEWQVATDAAAEAASLAQETHQPTWEAAAQTARSTIAAFQGDNESAELLLGEAEATALRIGASAVLCDIQFVRAIVALGAGRYEEALQHLQRTFDPRDPAHHHVRSLWRIGEFAEAAVHAGQGDLAREQLERAERLADLTQSPRLQIGVLYARPLLADDATAEPHFEAALSGMTSAWPLYRARLLLEYGAWLRRRRKIAQARMPLRAARDSLVALGAVPWAERARQELRASRET